MKTTHLAAQEGTDLDERDVRALTNYLLVVEEAPNLYLVYGEDGDEYTVDVEGGACTCPDAQYRHPDGGCKHARRVAFETGERTVPSWVDRGALDPLLVKKIDKIEASTPSVAADGGEIVVAGDEGEILDEAPEYTEHREPPEQGGERYIRCERCGGELLRSLGGRDSLLHRDDCPLTRD